ncbi:MAG: hypothetical protein GY708_00390 [Actinomycetia bacterium]|nr:hypothetical protein [Actinomycetes bacterium]MCP4961333.1 hypothetical protein [Actinomycetes bacterium]
MLKLADLAAAGGRAVRQDDHAELGRTTADLICRAIDEGRYDEAKALARYTLDEGRALHALFCDWVWDLLTRVADESGERAMIDILHGSQETWMMYRTWKGYLRMTVEERVQVTAEIMRSHYGGPDQDGAVEIIDRDDHIAIVMDPCGSGGRMRRGDPVEGTPSRLDPPYNFGATRNAHAESWGLRNVPYYCLHCANNEMLPMRWGGHPLWVTAYDPDAAKPCEWHFYKEADDIPEDHYVRVGMPKPRRGEGRY